MVEGINHLIDALPGYSPHIKRRVIYQCVISQRHRVLTENRPVLVRCAKTPPGDTGGDQGPATHDQPAAGHQQEKIDNAKSNPMILGRQGKPQAKRVRQQTKKVVKPPNAGPVFAGVTLKGTEIGRFQFVGDRHKHDTAGRPDVWLTPAVERDVERKNDNQFS